MSNETEHLADGPRNDDDIDGVEDPSVEDWVRLREQNKRNLRRSKRAQRFAFSAFVLGVVAVFGGIIVAVAYRDVPGNQEELTQLGRQQTETLARVEEVVGQLRTADTDRQCQSRAQLDVLAQTLDLLADNFSTPPAPDPERLTAVAGLRDTAEAIRMTPSCP